VRAHRRTPRSGSELIRRTNEGRPESPIDTAARIIARSPGASCSLIVGSFGVVGVLLPMVPPVSVRTSWVSKGGSHRSATFAWDDSSC
jgi:hypothetical protein